MAASGKWLGQHVGGWLGPVNAYVTNYLNAELVVSGFGTAVMSACALVTPSPPENGPSGGANWTRGYKPTHDYFTPRRRSRRDEILFLRG